MMALSHIEFLWEDLQAVKAWLHEKSSELWKGWVVDEVHKRQRWFAGLRQAWLAAVVV